MSATIQDQMKDVKAAMDASTRALVTSVVATAVTAVIRSAISTQVANQIAPVELRLVSAVEEQIKQALATRVGQEVATRMTVDLGSLEKPLGEDGDNKVAMSSSVMLFRLEALERFPNHMITVPAQKRTAWVKT